jgi:hypothetical protein
VTRLGVIGTTLHANPLYVPQSFLAPVHFQRDGQEYKMELSVVRKELVTGEVAAVIEYQLYVKMKPEKEAHTVTVPGVDKQHVDDLIAKMQTLPYATVGSQASWGGRNAGATVGGAITVGAVAVGDGATVTYVGGVFVVSFFSTAPAAAAEGPTLVETVSAGIKALGEAFGPMLPAGAGAWLLGQKQDKGKQQ